MVGRTNTYWEITRVTLKNEGKNGKAWGRFVYRGKFQRVMECLSVLTFARNVREANHRQRGGRADTGRTEV